MNIIYLYITKTTSHIMITLSSLKASSIYALKPLRLFISIIDVKKSANSIEQITHAVSGCSNQQ